MSSNPAPKASPAALKAHRAVAGLSNSEICSITGFSPETLRDWMRGRRSPRPENLVVLAALMSCEVKDLLATPDES